MATAHIGEAFLSFQKHQSERSKFDLSHWRGNRRQFVLQNETVPPPFRLCPSYWRGYSAKSELTGYHDPQRNGGGGRNQRGFGSGGSGFEKRY